jgi:phosphoenolpyruvate carboxykinase (ATP)
LVENVIMHPETLDFDYDNQSLTENTRAGFPIDFIPNAELTGVGKHPTTVIFLTADAFGVMPPVSKLSREQAMYHFMIGYTSKLAGTERGIVEPQAAFSTCFGEPFMPLKPIVYADLLAKKIDENKSNVYLVNTGWIGGAYGVGKRIDINYTRAMVTAALDGTLSKVNFAADPIFKVMVPETCPGVPSEILNPINAWKDKDGYKKKANELAAMFVKNFERFANVPDAIKKSGPAPVN